MEQLKKVISKKTKTDEGFEASKLLNDTLNGIAAALNGDETLRKEMVGDLGPINAVIGIKTDDGLMKTTVVVQNGEFRVIPNICDDKADAMLIFDSPEEFEKYVNASSDEAIRMFLASRVRIEGNLAIFGYVNYLISLLTWQDDIKDFKQIISQHKEQNLEAARSALQPVRGMKKERIETRLKAESIDKGVKWLKEPFLSQYTLDDFPRLVKFKEDHLNTMPEVTAEQGKLLTDYFVEHGFETQKDGTPWDPMLRTAKGFEYLMKNKKPVIRENDLLAGTVTPNPICGSVNQPYTVGWSIWGELNTIQYRELDPFSITEETKNTLSRYVFPFWRAKYVQQRWKDVNDYPLSAKINDRMFCFNLWGLVSLNPGSPGFEKIVHEGLDSLRKEIDANLDAYGKLSPASQKENNSKKNTWEAMAAAIDGMLAYTAHLAELVKKEVADTTDPKRKVELQTIYETLQRVPKHPARTLHEAVQSLWIMFIGICLDAMDESITIGRLDQILQPYFEADIKKLPENEREGYIAHAMELVGCLFLRFTNHLVAAATVASWQNSGAPGVTSVMVGGVTPEGEDAVNDMTYIVLKVAEMLSLNDPDMDARYMVGVNSSTYIRRVAELNYITSGTPSVHNDKAIIDSLCQHGWDIRDARNWVSCGCVEPVIHGQHFAATGDMDSNLMVPLTMAIYNGYHPSARWDFGPKTGEVQDFETFDSFYKAFEAQFNFIYKQATEASLQILRAQQYLMPGPLYSAMLENCIKDGMGMTHGGAKYNSSGTAFTALSDVVDSLLAIKKVVFEDKKYTFRELKDAMDADFVGYERQHAYIENRVPKFGSGHESGREMVQRVTTMIADYLHSHQNGRGGCYFPGYRTNNNHTVYGRVSGASASGRYAGKPFTSGLTPNPQASTNLLDNLNDVASIDPLNCENNYTFNVRLSCSRSDSHKQNVDHIANYIQTYFINGGMQIQINVVDTDTLKDAMAHPEFYPDLIARVSGYTGYYTRMQQDLQLEIIGRTEFKI
ncbi:MAG: hypothetical protein IH596_15390 [Bacteroidales bacterium]|nr:hypothetical protein [Bacteroidales bacterium]